MKSFFKKYGFALIFGLFCLGVVCLTIVISFDNLASTLSYQMDRNHEDATRYKANNRMIAYGENGVSTTPVSAKIENGILKIEAEVTNNSGKNLKVKDFAILTFGGYEFAADVKFDGDGTLNNGAVIKVTYEANISTFKNINVMPTTARIDFGAYDTYNNYVEFELKYVISWY